MDEDRNLTLDDLEAIESESFSIEAKERPSLEDYDDDW